MKNGMHNQALELNLTREINLYHEFLYRNTNNQTMANISPSNCLPKHLSNPMCWVD